MSEIIPSAPAAALRRVIGRIEAVVVSVLLAVFAAAGLDHAFGTSPAFDEPFFLHSGVTNLTAGAPKQATANLVLAQNWMALPIIFRRPFVEPQPEVTGTFAPPLEPATRFLFDTRNDWRWMLRAGRVMILLAGLALAVLVWVWSRELFGPAGALLSLGLYCLSPTMVANSSLATIDLFTALWFFVACRTWWRLSEKVTPSGVLACGVASGLLAATKISSVLLAPLVLALLAGRVAAETFPWFSSRRAGMGALASWRTRWRGLALAAAAAVAVAVITLWLCYLPQLTVFRATPGAAVSLEHLARAYTGSWSGLFEFLGRIHLFPELYLHDLKVFLATTAVRRAYMGGEHSLGGWWHFFPTVWFLKAPLPLLLALAGGALGLFWGRLAPLLLGGTTSPVEAAGRPAPARRELIPLAVLPLIYLGASMASGLNIGIRHILPVFPPLFVLAGAAVLVPVRRGWRHALAAAILLWSARELLTVRGQYLSYFNPFAGGSREGHRWFVDSSFEWGQDLPAYERWLEKRGEGEGRPPVYFSYFGNADLRRFRLGGTILLPQFYELRPPSLRDLGPGTYVISATMLHSLYGPLCGPWRASHETRYLELRGEFRATLERFAQAGSELKIPADQWSRLQLFEQLRFNRLCAHLRCREPDSRVTNGLLVYELSTAELAAALDGPPAETAPADAVLGSKRFPQEALDFIK